MVAQQPHTISVRRTWALLVSRQPLLRFKLPSGKSWLTATLAKFSLSCLEVWVASLSHGDKPTKQPWCLSCTAASLWTSPTRLF